MTDVERKEHIEYRIQNARKTIEELKTHIENKFWNTAGSRMYYACFYAAGALLMKSGISASSHSGTIRMFSQHFILTGKRNWASIFLNFLRKGKEVIMVICSTLTRRQ